MTTNTRRILAILSFVTAGSAAAQVNPGCPKVPMSQGCNDRCCPGDSYSGHGGQVGDPVSALSGNAYVVRRDIDVPGVTGFALLRRWNGQADDLWSNPGGQNNANWWGDVSPRTQYLPRPYGSSFSDHAQVSATWWNNLSSGVVYNPNKQVFWVDEDGVQAKFDGGGPSSGMLIPSAWDFGYRGMLWQSGMLPDGGPFLDGGTRFVSWNPVNDHRIEFGAMFQYPGTTSWYFLPTKIEDAEYRGRGTTISYARPKGLTCVAGAAGSTTGAPYVFRITTAEGTQLDFTWVQLPAVDAGLTPTECVLRSVSVSDKNKGGTDVPLVQYKYWPALGAPEASGWVQTTTWPAEGRSESYNWHLMYPPGLTDWAFEVDAGGFVTQTHLTYPSYPTATQTNLGSLTEPSFNVTYPNNLSEAAITEFRGLGVLDGGGTFSGVTAFQGVTRPYDTGLGSIHNFISLRIGANSSDAGLTEPRNYSSGEDRFEYGTNSGAIDSIMDPGYERSWQNRRGAYSVYRQQTLAGDAGNYLGSAAPVRWTPELDFLGIGAADSDGGTALESAAFTYTYGGAGQTPHFGEQFLSTASQASTRGTGVATTTFNRDPQTNRLMSVKRTGYTYDSSGNWQQKTAAAFFKSTNALGTDVLGRTVERHGPCFLVSPGDNDCSAGTGAYPVTLYTYYPDADTTNNRNRLSQLTRCADGSACSVALTTSFSTYDYLGNPQTVTDPNGDATSYTYDSGGHILSRTKAGNATRFAYEQGKLVRVMYPLGNGEVFCHRTGGDADCTTGAYDPRLLWRAKKTCTGTSNFSCTGGWSERINYFYSSVDGSLMKAEYRSCAQGSTCTAGTQGESRRVEKFAHDGEGRLTWRGWGDAPGQFGQARFYDRGNNLAGIGTLLGDSPDFCGGGQTSQPDSPASPLCAGIAHDLADRPSALTQYYDGVNAISSAFAYDPQGNVKQIAGDNFVYDDFGNVVEADLADTAVTDGGTAAGATTFAYDAMGNAVQKQTPAQRSTGNWSAYTYDALGRKTGAFDAPAMTQTYAFAYDSATSPPPACPQPLETKGRLRSSADLLWTTWYSYDAEGRVITEIRARAGDSTCPATNFSNPHTSYYYTFNGNLFQIVYPHGRNVYYSMGSGAWLDRVTSVSAGTWNGSSWSWSTVAQNVAWEPYGGLRGYQLDFLGSGTTAGVEYMLGDNGAVAPASDCPAGSPPQSATSDLTGRLRSLRVTSGNLTLGSGSGDILLRSYTWGAGMVSKINTCYLGETSAIIEDLTGSGSYDHSERLVSVYVPNYPTTGGYQNHQAFYYDNTSLSRSSNRTRMDVDYYGSNIAYTYDVNHPHRLLAEAPSLGTSLGHQYAYDLDGREAAVYTARDSSADAGTSTAFTYYVSNGDTSPKYAKINGATYAYIYDAFDRRTLKLYPTYIEDWFFYDTAHQLLEDVGNSDLVYSGSSTYPIDEYIWLGGRPIAVVRAKFDVNWNRLSDRTGTCQRNGDTTSCDIYSVVTDHIGKPILTLNSNRNITGVGEYDPFGRLNTVEAWVESPHPYAYPATDPRQQMGQPPHGMSTAYRAHYTLLDTQQDCNGNAVEGPSLWDWSGTVQLDASGGYHRGDTLSRWIVPTTAPGGFMLRFGANPGSCAPYHCGCNWNDPGVHEWGYWGYGLRGYEYRRYETGVYPYFVPLRFPGHYYDEETHLHEDWHRYYSPPEGRYLAREPVLRNPRYAAQMARRGHSAPEYAYVWNDPFVYSDPTGLYPGQGFSTPWAAAFDAAQYISAGSPGYESTAVVTQVGSNIYTYGEPSVSRDAVTSDLPAYSGAAQVIVHNHPPSETGYVSPENGNFSPQDVNTLFVNNNADGLLIPVNGPYATYFADPDAPMSLSQMLGGTPRDGIASFTRYPNSCGR